MKHNIQLTVNGAKWEGQVESSQTLLHLLRDQIGLTGTKSGCEIGECGACTVILNGEPVQSCIVLAIEANNGEVETVEGLGKNGKLDPLQESFLEEGAVQCGFCTPGMLMAGKALLRRNPNPSKEEIAQSFSGHICRCTGYESIISAVERAAKK
ncbi:MAG: (2Fe-2S)-binding protein [Bacillota bacterium]|jgi:aerobic-type carbon monoxide dehydrogenase small subunit (CoxS/CutS family)